MEPTWGLRGAHVGPTWSPRGAHVGPARLSVLPRVRPPICLSVRMRLVPPRRPSFRSPARLSVHPCVRRFLNPSFPPPSRPSIRLPRPSARRLFDDPSASASLCLPVRSVNPSLRQTVSVRVRLSVCPPARTAVRLSTRCPFAHPSVRLCVLPFVDPSVRPSDKLMDLSYVVDYPDS